MKYLIFCFLFGLFVCGCEAAKCNTDDDCVSTRFCQFRTGDCQGTKEGLCIKAPSEAACIGTGGVDFAVCGCDNQTYESDCWRKNARVSKQFEGRCEP